eukprot:CAMPEP_0113658866 /NCGR_PEP_ID=MMETSP0017_2-20120614/32011_1 /TAXON_ID=2856 /ORGANISM="Cylindrotheca closterium" /LENGTH=375 /DNA_ID=CAMNT_0000573295 /DNA_START=145 /DNA_END=1270 /DNA_ORIENTATION=- /assembly_acc=CAM_ASM_000147
MPKRKQKRKPKHSINNSPSKMRDHPIVEGASTPKTDNKRVGRIDKETASQIQKRDDDPSVIGTVVTTPPSPSSLSRNSTNSTEKNEREIIKPSLSDEHPHTAEASSNDDWKQAFAEMSKQMSHLTGIVSEQDKRISQLTAENKTVKRTVSEQRKQMSQQDKRISQLTTENKTVKETVSEQDNRISQQDKEIRRLTEAVRRSNAENKTLNKKFSDLETKFKEVNEQLNTHRRQTTGCEIAIQFRDLILQDVIDNHPYLKKNFKGTTLAELCVYLRHNPSLSKRAKDSNPEGKGYPLDQIHAIDQVCCDFAKPRNKTNHERYPGHRTSAVKKFFCEVQKLIPAGLWKKTRTELNVISETIKRSPEKEGVKKKTSVVW